MRLKRQRSEPQHDSRIDNSLVAETNLDLHGKAVMGSCEHHVIGEGSPGAPCVKIRGLSLWGSVGVKRKKRKPA